MDTITHTMFGFALYGTAKTVDMPKNERRALFFAVLAGSQIPDIDVISALWDTNGQYQMWHRGITHSIFLAPFWALILSYLFGLIFKTRLRILYPLTLLAVVIHCTADIFNAWGTGYLEPFSQMRLTFGTISIVDLVFWALMLAGFLYARFGPRKWPAHIIYRAVWLFIVLQVLSQSVQGYILYQQHRAQYEQLTLVADFIPFQFTVVGKNGDLIELRYGNVFRGTTLQTTLRSNEQANKQLLFDKNPRARTLVQWSPFVVFVEDQQRIAVYDPRFYRNGSSFLIEQYDKSQK
jgi:inner membrane protein